MNWKKILKKIYFLVVIVFVMWTMSACSRKKESQLETQKFTDVLGVYHDVYVINNNGLMYLLKGKKKISKDYYTIRPLLSDVENKDDNWNHFLAQDESLNYFLVDNQGQETPLSDKYESVQSVYQNVIVFNLKDSEYALYFIDTKNEVICKSYNTLSKYLYLCLNETKEGTIKSLINIKGEPVFNNLTDYSLISLTTPELTINVFYKVLINDKFTLINYKGDIITSQTYPSISQSNSGVIKCSDGLTNETYVNYNGDVIFVDRTKDTIALLTENFIITSDFISDEKTIYFFNGQKIPKVLGFIESNFGSYNLKYKTDTEFGFINALGNVVFTTTDVDNNYDMQSVSVDDDDSYYLIKGPSYYLSNDKGQSKKLNISGDYIVSSTPIAKVFRVNKGIPGDNNIGLFTFDNIPDDISTVKFYDKVLYRNKYILGFDNIDKTISVLDSNNLNSLDIKTNMALDVFTSIDHTSKIKNYTIEEESLYTIRLNFTKIENNKTETFKTYLLYWYNEEDMRHFEIEKDAEFSIMSDLLVVTEESNTIKIYKPNEEFNDFTLLATTTKEILNVFKDGKKYYYSYRLNFYYGLLNADGTIALNAQFQNIKGVKDGHVIVKRSNYYGLVKLQKSTKYKIVLNIEYEEMMFLDNVLLVSNHLDENYIYSTSGKKLVKDRVVDASPIIYTTINPDEENGYEVKTVLKLFFGSYVRLMHYDLDLNELN